MENSMFDFMSDSDPAEEETPEESPTEEIATSGNPEPVLIHQGLTKEQILSAQARAESKKGLDMNEFMKETNSPNLNFEELLRFEVKE